jgi:hypothetical protein
MDILVMISPEFYDDPAAQPWLLHLRRLGEKGVTVLRGSDVGQIMYEKSRDPQSRKEVVILVNRNEDLLGRTLIQWGSCVAKNMQEAVALVERALHPLPWWKRLWPW